MWRDIIFDLGSASLYITSAFYVTVEGVHPSLVDAADTTAGSFCEKYHYFAFPHFFDDAAKSALSKATLKPTYQITEISNPSLSWVGSYCETNDCVPGCHLSGHSFGSSWKSWMVFYSFNLPKLQT